jgi:hypothetical protein
MTNTLKKPGLLAILNLAGYILIIVMNSLANALPINNKTTGEISASYPNLFTPAGYTFSIWGIIYILLLVFVIYQLYQTFRSPQQREFIGKIGYWFLISCLANASWILAWHHELILLSVFIMLVLFISLAAIYSRLGIGQSAGSGKEKYIVRMPFSIYFGWINVAAIANIAILLVDSGWERFGLSEQFWALIITGLVILLAAYMLFRRKDIFFLAVIVWALGGVLYKRMYDSLARDSNLEILLIAGLTFLIAAGIFQLFRKKVY